MTESFVQTFQLESTAIRGRIVRLTDTLDDILARHNYPDDAAQMTAEALTLCTILSAMLKYDGIFTLQISGDGPVRMVVADVTSAGHVRAYAGFSEEELKAASFTHNRAELLGKGYMAFTVDQGAEMERYQGIVELKPESLVTSIQHYFAQSEQINTGIVMEAGRVDGKWRACGIMVQEMPADTQNYNQDKGNIDEDDWRRTMILLGSVKREEMLSPELSAQDLLYRLFHEEGVRIYEPKDLVHQCRCDVQRGEAVLVSMPEEDIDEMAVNGTIEMVCEFCSRTYEYDPEDLKKQKGQMQ